MQRYLGVGAISLVAFLIGWLVGGTNKHLAVSRIVRENDALLARTEPLQDPVELKLIRGLEVGDDLSNLPQLMMLVDEVIQPQDDSFDELYNYLSKTTPLFEESIPDLPKDSAGCEILYFDLRTIEHEGAKSYYVVMQGTTVLAVIIGEYWMV